MGLRLPATAIKAGAEVRGRLQKVGLLRDSGHEHFNGCLVVPVFDAAGQVTEVYGRKITPNVNPPWHLYLPGPHRGVWNERGMVGQGEVILTEALIDAMTFWCAGYRNVTAAYGVEGLTEDHLVTFKRLGVRRVLIAFDRDDAGERGAEKGPRGQGPRGQVLPLAPDVFLPLSSGLTNPIGRLGGSGGAMSWFTASISCLS